MAMLFAISSIVAISGPLQKESLAKDHWRIEVFRKLPGTGGYSCTPHHKTTHWIFDDLLAILYDDVPVHVWKLILYIAVMDVTWYVKIELQVIHGSNLSLSWLLVVGFAGLKLCSTYLNLMILLLGCPNSHPFLETHEPIQKVFFGGFAANNPQLLHNS